MDNNSPSEENLRRILEDLPDGIVICTDDDELAYINPYIAEMTGHSLKKLYQMAPLDIFHPDVKKTIAEMRRQRLAGAEVADHYETVIQAKDGNVLPIEIKASRMEWDGRPATMFLIRDVSERQRLEQGLRQREEDFRTLAEKANEGISITDNTGLHIFCNQRFLNMLGYTMDEVLKLKRGDIIHQDDSKKTKVMRQARKRGEKYPEIYEIAYKRKDGSALPVEVSVMHANWGNARVHVFFARDISERKQSEEERLRASRLESLAVLAGGIAHEFNNSLTGILGNVSVAQTEVPPGNSLQEILQDIERAAKEAGGLTQQLLTFARGGDPKRQEADLRELIRDAVSFTLRGSNVRSQLDLAEDLWQSNVDATQIRQVLSNIVINAEQALPDGGLIEVSAGNRMLRAANSATLPPGDYIRIEIKDHGVGISPEYIDHIFDPYFSTKQGSGLGLATAYSVIRKHEGHIRVNSTPGEGTAVAIYLPASREKIAAPPAATEQPKFQGHNVLLMDDEALVRNTGRRMLERLGYRVATAKDGAEAVWLYRESLENDRFDLAILDLTVPGGMGALEAQEKLKALDPQIKVFISSGYANDPVMNDPLSYGFEGVVKKPYTLEEMTAVMGYARQD